MNKLLIGLVCSIAGLGLAPFDVSAQTSKTSQVVSVFRPVVARPSESTVRILADGKDAALGVVVSSDGWILSKYSELKDKKIKVRLPGAGEADAVMFGHNDPFDLVMLKVDAKDLKPIEWAPSNVAKLGHWVASAGPGQDPVAIGIVSVLTRPVKGAKFVPPSGGQGGFLGMALDLDFSGGVRIQEILPETPASRAGLKADDKILAVNGETVENSEEFLALIARKKPGDIVKLKLTRAAMEFEKEIMLAERPGSKNGKSKGEMQNAMGSKLSARRAGFPIILQHDTVLKPTDCGGPLVNLDGKVIGVNICRAGRTESYAIPSEVVQPLLEQLKQKDSTAAK